MSGSQEIAWSVRSQAGDIPRSGNSQRWRGFSAEVFRIAGPIEFDFSIDVRGGYLALHNLVRADGETLIGGLLRSSIRDIRRKMTFVPPGGTVEGWSNLRLSHSSVLAVHFDPSDESEAVEVSSLPPELYFEDDGIKSTLAKIASLLGCSGQHDTLYADTLGMLLRLELRRRLHPSGKRDLLRGGLTPRQLARLCNYVDANIAADISLQDLSGLLGISRFHLLHAFKKSIGRSPYQYVLGQRVERAKALLRERTMAISEVANAVGFRSSLQLNRAFKRFAGRSPAEFRRERD